MVGTEAVIVSAVISGTLKIVGNKLAPLLIKEHSSIVGVKKDLQELHGQVVEINWWLETVGDKAMRNYPSFNWLKQLKDVAYDVDDLVDEFHLKAEKHEANGDSGRHSVSKYLRTKPKSFMFQYKAAHRLKAIKKRFAAIVKQRTDFSAIANSVPVGHPVCQNEKTMPSFPIVNVTSVIGRDQEKQQIISMLVETKDQQEMGIVSVVGLGGSGKTTFAKLVFCDDNIIKHFEVRLWVCVSQEFDIEMLIKKLFEAFADNDPGHHALPYMSQKTSEKLNRRRFLLVLDDVWTELRNEWDEKFMVHLQSGAPGSRILLTTRSQRVAEALGSANQVDLSFLSPSDSWQLFERSLFMPEKSLLFEFVEVGKEIVKKCGGMPLAIKILAGALRGKERIEEWQAVRDSNLLDVKSEEHNASVYACLRLSYFHLPSHLKQCFTICSVFPKGHEIDKEQLIDQWIAHDMITPVDGVDYLEYSGDKYFNYLVQISFLQDVNEDYRRVTCKMHDLVHDLARSIIADEILLVLPQEAASSTKSYRYFCLTEQPRNLLPRNIFEKTRAIYVGNGDYITFCNSLKNARHLRSITVDYVNTTVPSTILHIKYLRYLCIPKLKCLTLPEAITDIWSLQALHVPYSDLIELPKSIGKLQRLRTLNLSCSFMLKSLPDSVGDCHMISTIDLSCCRDITLLPNSMERNKKLRVLRLDHTNIKKLPPGITTLGHLECLDLEGCQGLEELPDGMGNLKKLEVLNLRYCNGLESMPVEFGKLTRLQKLSLFVVGQVEKSAQILELGNVARIGGDLEISNIADVMDPNDAQEARLKQKTNLQTLTLRWGKNGGVNVEKEVAILDGLEPPTGIKVLEIDGYAGGRFAQWMLNQVGIGVQGPQFSCLTWMKLYGFLNLKHLDGLVELPCLEKLELVRMPSLVSISGGPFPSLLRLVMVELPTLGDMWMISERTTSADREGDCSSNCSPNYLGQVQIGIHLSYLSVERCPILNVRPYLPLSLEHLRLIESNEHLLLSLGQVQGSSDANVPAGFNFSRLKDLEIERMAPTSLRFESGCGWELLQHLTALEFLRIYECNGLTELPESMRSLTSLRSLHIMRCSALCKLPDWLGELRSLQEISIKRCSSVSSLSPSLHHLTTLHALDVIGSSAILQLPERLGELHSLQTLRLKELRSLSSLPQSLQNLASLKELEISDCDELQQLPECLGILCSMQTLRVQGLPRVSSLPQSLQHLTSLKKLEIYSCGAIHELPEGLGELRSLRAFCIQNFPGLACLPQSMRRLTSLEVISITDCQGLTSLPEWIKDLTALQELWIWNCPDLKRRCERGNGEDWHLISHIPCLSIW